MSKISENKTKKYEVQKNIDIIQQLMDLEVFRKQRWVDGEPTKVHSKSEITCGQGCKEVLEKITTSPNGTIDTPRGNIIVDYGNNDIVVNGKVTCLKIRIQFEKRKAGRVVFAHSFR